MATPSRSAAFRTEFDAHHQAVRAFCYRRLPASDAEDVAAEVFLVLWRRLDEAPCGGECRLWLFGVAGNVIRNKRRSALRSRRLELRVAREPRRQVESPEVVVVRNAEEDRVWAALGRLRPTDRELVLLRSWEELSSAEIGTVMGLTAKAVDSRLHRVRAKLVKLMAPESTTASPGRVLPVEEGGER